MKKIFYFMTTISLWLMLSILVSCKNGVFTDITNSFIKIYHSNETNGNNTEIKDNETQNKKDNDISNEISVLNVGGYRNEDKNTYIEIEFSKEIKDGFDASSYIKIEPEISYTISKVGKSLFLKGDFSADTTYKVTVLKGIKSINGFATDSDKIFDVEFAKKKPKLMFTNDGIILPLVNDKKIYIRSLNVKRINVIVRKVYANNLTQFLQRLNFSGNGRYEGSFRNDDESEMNKYENDYDDYYYYDQHSSFYNVGDELYNVNFDIENEVDTWVQTAIDLTGVLEANGMYVVEAKFDRDGTTYKFNVDNDGYIDWEDREYINNNGIIRKTVLLTNIGIVAEESDEGIRANVLDIIENNLIRGVKVYLISKNNQILEEQTSDDNGQVRFNVHKNGFYILADDKSSKSVLPLKNSLNTNGFNVDGAYATGGIRGYIYTERGVYRPGDSIYVSIIVRNNNEQLYDNQPVKITVYDPTGIKMIDDDVIKDGKNGFYTYTFNTNTSSRTGIWKLEAKIGDAVIKKDISVEAVVANKIRVNLDIPDVINIDDENNEYSISSNYLYGSPSSNLEYSVSFQIKEEPINFEKYKDYSFSIPSTYGYSDYKYLNGTLDKNGFSKLEPDFSDVRFGSLNMLVDATGRVVQDGGRAVNTKKYVKLKKYDTYIGIENTNTYRRPGSNINLKAICVTEDGESLVPNKTLKYRVYSNNHYWWWDYSDYNSFVMSFKSDKNTTLLYEGNITTADVPVLIDYETPNAEYIYVELEDETTGQMTGVNLQSSEWVDLSVTKKVETLNVSTDKKKYNVGDIAQIKFKGAVKSKAIISIEKAGKIINQIYKDVDNNEIIEQINVTKEMVPNVYVYVTLLQDYLTKENDRPLRLYGIVPINVEDEDSKIDLEISAPEEVKPNEKFVVKVKNKKNKQVDFTIAVVDEGLLDITAYKTPKPFDYFFQKLAAKLKLYDNYSEIIDRPYGAIHQILKVGGGEEIVDEMARRNRLKQLGLEDADRFKPVSMFKGVLTTDINGDASIDFDMPNYMGQVRIMVVAADGMSFGSADKDMIVKAPIIVESSLPRSMKVGDKLKMPVSVSALEDDIGDVDVYYTFKGKTQNKTLTIDKGEKEIVYFEEEIANEIGNEELTIGVKSKVYNYEETVGMAINSNNTPIEINENKELKGRTDCTFNQGEKYVKGTVDSFITVSNTMMLGLDKRLKYLIRYPYGCLEQTISSVFPQLFIEKLSTSKNYDKEKVVDNINVAISRLKLFQLPNGAFSYWPGDNTPSDWASNYAGHFLILAKKNGYYIPESMYNDWLDYTNKNVRKINSGSDYDVDLKSYALYLLALADSQNVSEMNYMYENYLNKNMNTTSKMYLAAAYKLIGEDKTAINIASSITPTSVKKSFDDLYEKDRYYYNYSYGSKLREIAVYLDCYYTIYGKRDNEAFDEIVSAMRGNNWYSTQTTAYSFIALSNVIEGKGIGTVKGIVDVDGVKTEYSTDSRQTIKIPEGAKKIKVVSDSDIITYVNYYLEAVPVNANIKDYAKGFTISRKYYDNEGKSIDVSKTNSGDTFWLEVIVSPEKKNIGKVENIALTQILPSGWEIENLRISNSNEPKWVEDKSKETTISYTDIRDDRIMWFFDYTSNHDYSFFVKINAVTKGEFDFPGTLLEAMYDIDFRAYKKGSRILVK